MQANLTTLPADRQSQILSEIAETLRTLRAADFRLESEYHPFGDWESRLELAEELRATLGDLDDRLADVIVRVAADLECEAEDFSQWKTRADAARRVRTVINSIDREGRFA